MNLKRLFYNWLYQKSILKQFKYNLRSIRDPNFFGHSPNIRNNVYTEPRWFVCDAFVWEETNEGFGFWSHIDLLWIKFLRSKYPSLI
jgi:hypothetical protein